MNKTTIFYKTTNNLIEKLSKQENIEVLEIDFQKAIEMIEKGEIMDAKTIMLIQYLQLKNIL